MKQVYLTLIAVVRNQEHYIKEWLAFHRIVGVERFVILLHRCEDETFRKITELPFQDDIHVHEIVDERAIPIQMGAYRWAVEKYGRYSRWLMFLDSDEFYFGSREDSLPEILGRYEKFGGLAAHWHHFGHGDHVLKPTGSSLEAFTRRHKADYKFNKGIKSIVQTEDLLSLISPHYQLTSRPIVTEDYRRVDFSDTFYTVDDRPPCWNIVRCNHYYTRSMEDWIERSKRGSCNFFHKKADFYSLKQFMERGQCAVNDREILRFSQRIKEMLGNEYQ